MKTKKCSKCGEVKSANAFSYYSISKKQKHAQCKKCSNLYFTAYRNTEKGYLKTLYCGFNRTDRTRIRTCYFTFEEFEREFEKHRSIYGMRSAWGPGVNHLDKHLPITMSAKGDSAWSRGGGKRTASNLSVDRLDSNRDYTLQNIIFIRCDENARKHSSSYEDCKIQIRLYEERFIKMKAI